MSHLEGKIALVTGASRGIGKAIATQLAEQGATVIGTATSDTGAAAITDYLSASGGKGLALNVTDKDSVETAIKEIAASYGGIDILVNNAGITRDNLLMRMKESEWQDIMDTNLTAIFTLSKAVLRGMMKKRFGRIVNIGSVVGSSGNAGQANYAAAKAGVMALTRCAALEAADFGVRINAVAPSLAMHPFLSKVIDEDTLEQMTKQEAFGRSAEVWEVSNVMVFLASDLSSYMTGETVSVSNQRA